jgi:hypothetical protein
MTFRMQEISCLKEPASAVRHDETGFKDTSAMVEISRFERMQTLFQCGLSAPFHAGVRTIAVYDHFSVYPDV